MVSIILAEAGQVQIPADVVDLESFRRWAKSDEFPEHGWFSYLAKARTLVGQVDAYRRLHRNLRVYHRIQVLDFDERAATKFQRLRQAHRRIGAMDLKIASIVIAHDSTRLSKNVRDFSQVAGPRLEDWTV